MALEARVRVTPAVPRATVADAGLRGVTATLTGVVTDVLLLRSPDQWQIVVESRPPPGLDPALPVEPEPTAPVRWTVLLSVASGMVSPFDEGDLVTATRHAWLDRGLAEPPPEPVTQPSIAPTTAPEPSAAEAPPLAARPVSTGPDGPPSPAPPPTGGTVRESIILARQGEQPGLVFVDGPVPIAFLEPVPSQVRPTPTSTVVYTTSGRDERACHRLVEHRAFAFLGGPTRLLRPGESVLLEVGAHAWTVTAVDLAVTTESTTCPDRVFSRAAWLAVRERQLAPLLEAKPVP